MDQVAIRDLVHSLFVVMKDALHAAFSTWSAAAWPGSPSARPARSRKSATCC